MKVRKSIWLLLGVTALTGCRLIDEDTLDCGMNVDLTYDLRLVTDVQAQLHEELDGNTPAATIAALQDYLEPVFSPVAQDADLAFFRGPAFDHRAHKAVNATQFSYQAVFKEGEYLHLAVANTDGNRVASLVTGEQPEEEYMPLAPADTVDSQKTGLFSARKSLDLPAMGQASYHVTLDMVNSAVAMVADTTGSRISRLWYYGTGFASRFDVSDSTYRFESPAVVRADEVRAPGGPLCLSSVNYPSRDTRTRSDSGDAIWEVQVFARCASGSVTKTTLGFNIPLKAGRLKIIRVKVLPDGSVVPADSGIGVNVIIDWHVGIDEEIDL